MGETHDCTEFIDEFCAKCIDNDIASRRADDLAALAAANEQIRDLKKRLKAANDGACDQCGTTDYEGLYCDKCLHAVRAAQERDA